MPRHATPYRAMPCRAMASFRLSALTGALGAFGGPFELLGFLRFRPPCRARLCHARPCHAIPWLLLALCSASLGRLTELRASWIPRNSVLLVEPCHATPCHFGWRLPVLRFPALAGVSGAFDSPLSFSGSSEFRPDHHVMQCHATACLVVGQLPHGSPFLPSPMPLVSLRPRPRGLVPRSGKPCCASPRWATPCCVG